MDIIVLQTLGLPDFTLFPYSRISSRLIESPKALHWTELVQREQAPTRTNHAGPSVAPLISSD